MDYLSIVVSEEIKIGKWHGEGTMNEKWRLRSDIMPLFHEIIDISPFAPLRFYNSIFVEETANSLCCP